MKTNYVNFRNYILVFITGLILSSCSKDPTPTDNLVGTWTAGTSTFTAMIGDKTLAQYFTDVMGLTTVEAQVYTNLFNTMMQQSFAGTIQLKSDNTYTSTMGGDADTGTWSLSADAKKLTIDSNTGDPMILDIIELTSGKLQVQMSESISEDLNGDTTPEVININVVLNFTKS
jgi:hypothetical protein